MPSWLLWGVGFWLTGLLLFLATPIIIAPNLPRNWRTRLTKPYTNLAQRSMGRSLIVPRSPGADWIQTHRDGELEAEALTLDGEPGHARDTGSLLGRLGNYPLGFVHPTKHMIYDLRTCLIGELERERVTNNDHIIEQDDGTTTYTDKITVPTDAGFVDLEAATAIIPKSGDIKLGEITDSYVEKSQAGFKTGNTAQYMLLLGSFVLGIGTVVGIVRYILNGDTGGGTTIPDIAPYIVGVVV